MSTFAFTTGGLLRATTTPPSASSVSKDGYKFDADGDLHISEATPASTDRYNMGLRFAPNGELYVTRTIPSQSYDNGTFRMNSEGQAIISGIGSASVHRSGVPIGSSGAVVVAEADIVWSLDANAAENITNACTVAPTVTRATTKTRVNSSGLIETVATGTILRDFDPVTLAVKGFLIEEARTNLLLRSEEFDNAVWGKDNITVSSNSATSPSGTASADKVEATLTATTNLAATATATASAHTYSIYIKKGSGAADANRFGLYNSTTASNLLFVDVDYDLETFSYAVGSTGVTLTPVGNGWLRLVMSQSTGITVGNSLNIYAGFSGGGGTAGEFAYFWGAQLEAGSFATSYIPTTSAAVTRNADVVTVATSSIPGFSATAQSMYVEAIPGQSLTPSGLSPGLMKFDDGTANERIGLYVSSADDNTNFDVVDGGVNQVAVFRSGAAVDQTTKFAYALTLNDAAFVVNGGTATTDAAVTMPTVTTLRVGLFDDYLNGHIRALRLYNVRKANADLVAMTAL